MNTGNTGYRCGRVRTYATMPLMNGIPEEFRVLEESGQLTELELDRELSGVGRRPLFRGATTVELILVLVVLISLVMIFKTQLTSLVNLILSRISTNANNVMR